MTLVRYSKRFYKERADDIVAPILLLVNNRKVIIEEIKNVAVYI